VVEPVSCAAITEKRRVVHLPRRLVGPVEVNSGDLPSGFELKWGVVSLASRIVVP
jgi:hypothetical protein